MGGRVVPRAATGPRLQIGAPRAPRWRAGEQEQAREQGEAREPQQRHPTLLLLPAEARLPAEGAWFGFGSAFKAYGEVMVPVLGARLAGFDASPLPLASAVARLAAERFRRGETIDAALAAPLYVRDKVAMTTAERLARGAKA